MRNKADVFSHNIGNVKGLSFVGADPCAYPVSSFDKRAEILPEQVIKPQFGGAVRRYNVSHYSAV